MGRYGSTKEIRVQEKLGVLIVGDEGLRSQ